jgi:hypothetical protein
MENKYSIYRDIRYKRTFRTLGKMSWWRIVLGFILIVLVVFIAGLPSQMLASREEFRLAEKLMISPEWMDKYKPETKAFIEAGVLYEDGKIEEAYEAFDNIESFEAAEVMKNRCNLKLASSKLESGIYDDAYTLLLSVNLQLLDDVEREVYMEYCADLKAYYEGMDSEQGSEYAFKLSEIVQKAMNE